MLTLGDIKMNFRTLTMEFYYRGRKHCLRGAGRQVILPGAGKLAKLSGNHSQLCIIQVVPDMNTETQWYALETRNKPDQDPRLLELLHEFKHLFD